MFKRIVLVLIIVMSFTGISFANGHDPNLVYVCTANNINFYVDANDIECYDDYINCTVVAVMGNKDKSVISYINIYDTDKQVQWLGYVVMQISTGEVISVQPNIQPKEDYVPLSVFDRIAKTYRK